jgi:dihydrofolate reductase
MAYGTMGSMKTVALIYAVSENHVIGKDNAIPWHLPADFKHFKEVTTGSAVIMGRLTFESIGRPLPGRQNIVLTRDPDYEPAGVDTAISLDDAIAKAHSDTVFVIGGAGVYQEALPLAKLIYETRVNAVVDGDTFFDPDLSHWLQESEEIHQADERNKYDYTFITYVRQ